MSEFRSRIVAFGVSVLLIAPALAIAQSKEAKHQEMLAIAAQIQALKPQAAANQEAAATLAGLLAQYQDLSRSMGGDDPAAVGTNGSGGPSLRVQGVLPVPPNCISSVSPLVNNTPVAIADVATSSSVINAAGVGPYLFHVSVTTNITHTFAADMDISLISPAGTVVTLSTDNGAGNDNVFNGTLWNDQTGTPATDFIYANLVTATPLIAEEALAAFRGEDPNGTWTLQVIDDLTGDVGSIDSWALVLTTFPAAPILSGPVSVTNNTPTAIVDVGTVSPTLVMAGAGTFVIDVDLTTNITNTFAADLDMFLVSPGGSSTTLSTDNGAGNDNVFNGTLWNDDGGTPASDFIYANLVTATPLVPEGALDQSLGEDPNGTWTLTVTDDLTGDVGSIDSWTVSVTTATCTVPDADLSLVKTSDAAGEVQLGDPVVYTLTATNDGPSGATGVVVTDTLPAGLTYVSNDCGASFAAPTVTWNIGAMAANASAVCNVTVTASAVGVQINNASIDGNETDPVPGDNSDLVTINVNQTILAIPTVDTVGMVVLVGLLAFAAVIGLRRRRQT